jgi:hypothetical protein
VQQKERFHPNNREELELFIPQQTARMVESPIEMRILDYLCNHVEGCLLPTVQTVTVLSAIGIDITKLGPGRFHEKQAGGALRKFGWERKRAKAEVRGRPWVYVRPANWPDCMDLDGLEDDAPDAAAPAEAGPAPGDSDEPILAAEPATTEGSNDPF